MTFNWIDEPEETPAEIKQRKHRDLISNMKSTFYHTLCVIAIIVSLLTIVLVATDNNPMPPEVAEKIFSIFR